MTDEEVDRLVELIAELNRRHALVVVEHDMQFIRRIAKHRHRLPPGRAC